MKEIELVVCLMAVLNVALVIMHTNLAKKHKELRELVSVVTTTLVGAVTGDAQMLNACKKVHSESKG
jgi:hypothetical protein